MKKQCFMLGMCLTMVSVHSAEKPQADVFLEVTSERLIKHLIESVWYSGFFSVTNTGTVPFTIVIDEEWSSETTRFYREGDEKEQQIEDARGAGQRRKTQERGWVLDAYHLCFEKNKPTKTLQPGEGASFKCKEFTFAVEYSAPAQVYKAEMYLGDDTWIPVHITPTLGTLFPIGYGKDGKATGSFWSTKAGTNRYLYVKEDDKFNRVTEVNLKTKPVKVEGEDAVTFESPDGEKKKLTRDQARQIIREREQQNQ